MDYLGDDLDKKKNDPALTPRRATRNRNKPKKFEEFLDISPVKRKTYNLESSDEEFDDENATPKPKALFDANDDVEGQDIFKFKSRHTKNDLQNKVKEAISNTTNTPKKTPKKSNLLHKGTEATPKHVVNIMKRRIIQAVESDSSGSDFSGSSSDFVPDKSDEESESSASDSASDVKEKSSPNKTTKAQVTRNRDDKLRQKDSEYYVTPDNYFIMNSTKKITTSDHTLARLKNLNLNENIKEADIHVSKEHQQSIKKLTKSYAQLFDRWLYVLSENFNVILYGIGSKIQVLQRFQAEKLKDMPCIVVNGFFPSLTMKNVLETIVVDLLDNTHVPSNIGDAVNLIEAQLEECGVHLFVIVHNLDGVMLRSVKAQAMFANLAQLRNVHLIATIDHINAPLLWDHSKLSKFNFTWWDVTTFLPYVEETSFENSLLSQRSGALQLASLQSVYQSLTANAKGIFQIIIKYQLENHKQSHYQGLPFKELYSAARSQFLVSSQLALRAQLTEFLDHKLVKQRRTGDAADNLLIPMDSALLQHFLDQLTTTE
ncbi:origin recognition complex subunit 2 [Maniola hyperantus]|uniref:origin recognition complex subunit 2 n=1 Tax=Aphantopus hyperantus TaxID=2795564 RepID=UPI0015684F3F|nr:origin recognition complex subunit 2 [Maniola hyperantus]